MCPQIIPFRKQSVRRGFTLIEVMLVVIILGVLAGVVFATVSGRKKEAENTAFVTSLKTYVDLFYLYRTKNGAWPLDKNPGVVPVEMATDLTGTDWTRTTPIGGNWDWDEGVFGVTAAVSVHGPSRTDAEMAEVDRLVDDGDINTGKLRKRSNGFMFVIEE